MHHSRHILSAAAVAVMCVAGAGLPSAVGDQPAATRTVLAVNWSTEDFPSSAVVDASIREVFRSRPDLAIDYFSEYLESDRFPAEDASVALREYIRRKYRTHHIDLVLAVSSVALRFVLENRDDLFPGVPVVYHGIAAPELRVVTAGAGLTGIVSGAGFSDTLALALTLHPATERVYVIAQAPGSPVLPDAKAGLAVFEDRVQLTYIDEASMEGLLAAVRAVSGRSLILYIRYSREDPGRVQFPNDIAPLVGEAATVPVYGIADGFLGTGIVGGVMHETPESASRAALIACRILDGERPQDIPIEQATLAPVFDWRQLKRWGIDPSRLPADARIRFRDPTVWEEYRWYLVGTVSVVALQTLLIAALVAHRARRRGAEAVLLTSEAALRRSYERIRQLAGQLISTREAERSRIARELHDNLGQQMALLSMDIELLEQKTSVGDGAAGRVRALAERAGNIASDVHNLSHSLHPAKLEMLGLVSALQGLCRETSASHGVEVEFRHQPVPRNIPPDAALSLFRITQEALHNVAKHSDATRANVELSLVDGVLQLEITDSGRGFAAGDVATQGLGLLSMRERVHLVGGHLAIDAAPGAGTRITVRLPVDRSDLQPHSPEAVGPDP